MEKEGAARRDELLRRGYCARDINRLAQIFRSAPIADDPGLLIRNGAEERLRASLAVGGGPRLKLYRINKVAKPGGVVVKKKDVLAASDKEALQRAAESEDCPVCDVLRDGKPVGSIV